MVLCLHLFRRDDTLYDTFFVNNKCRTERAHILAAAHALLTPCAKFLGQFMFRINFWCDFWSLMLTPTTS